MSNYIEKRWSKEVMEKRLENLKKVINPYFVDSEIANGRSLAENELDALYIAYYNLKDLYCKIKRSSFGKPKQVGYVPKKKPIGYYAKYWEYEDEWAYLNNYADSTSSTLYSTSTTTLSYNYYDTWVTTATLNR